MKPIIIANWKMNPTTLAETKKLFESVKKGVKNIKNTEVIICPPFIWLPFLLNPKTYPLNLKLGAQDCFWEAKGAFTGEISSKMLKDFGVGYVIIGHSERRKYQKETDEIINKKIKSALSEKIKPILCVANISQVKKSLKGFSGRESKNIIMAYEPIFAIGTGKPCSTEKAKKMRLLIKKTLKQNMPILYGGSVNAQNAKDYLKDAGFQGLLVGGASLISKEFIGIIRSIEG